MALPAPLTPAREYVEWLSETMAKYEKLAKALVEHNAEKGRIVESALKTALRTMLPARYKLGTGFVITATGRSSPQLDIVIYDDLENAPIIMEGGVGLFPVECVYGFIEVKSDLTASGIAKAAEDVSKVRALASDKIYVGYETHEPTPGKPEVRGLSIPSNLPPRSFIFALRSAMSYASCLQAVQDETTKCEAHIHGLAVLNKEWLLRQRAWTIPYRFDSVEGQTFARFADNVLRCVQSFPMQPAEMTRYLGLAP